MKEERKTRSSEAPSIEAKPKKKKGPTLWDDIKFLLLKLLLIAGFLAILFTFFFGITKAQDNTMAPSIQQGDLVVYYRLSKDLVKDEVAVIGDGSETQIRRVAAAGGDTVSIDEDGLKINTYGQQEDELKIHGETLPFVDGIEYPVTLSSGEYFFLADDRESAEDSRAYGAVSEEDIKGQVVMILRRRQI